jgi:hypothetical protein
MSIVLAPLADTASRVAHPSVRVDVPRVPGAPGVDEAHARARAATVAWIGVCTLIVVAPFEALQPLVRLPGQSVSTVETALLAALAAWVGSLAWWRVRPVWRTALTAPWIVFIATMVIASVAAPAHRGNALGMSGRLALAFAVYLLTVNAIDSPARVRGTFIAAAGAAAILWPLIAFEYAGAAPVRDVLGVFRPFTANVGGQVRAAGPFLYPTIASMYLEIVFALLLGLCLTWTYELKFGRALAICVMLVATGQAIGLTFTRAGLITLGAASVIVGAASWRLRLRSGPAAVAAVLALIAIQIPTSRSFESLGLRFTSEGQNSWHRASFDVPVDVAIPAGGITTVPVKVTNTGRSTWDSTTPDGPFRLSYHWLTGDDRVASWQGLRTDFPFPIPPGASVTLDVRVEAPMKAGEYRLMWDIERENWLWFSTEPDAVLFVSRAMVSGPDVGPLGLVSQVPLPTSVARPGRLTLWRAALRMLARYPLTGVGPDNYRLMYGTYAGLGAFDTRVHTNNMYVEMLVGGGALGGLAFAWLCWRACGQFVAAARPAGDTSMALMGIGVLAAGAAIAIHGFVDSFLSFTATYILIAVTLGLASACAATSHSHAHRV